MGEGGLGGRGKINDGESIAGSVNAPGGSKGAIVDVFEACS